MRTPLRHWHRDESGTSVMEFVLIAPWIVFLMVILISLTYAGIARHQTVAAARHAAFYQRVSGNAMTPGEIRAAVSGKSGSWKVNAREEPAPRSVDQELGRGGGLIEAAGAMLDWVLAKFGVTSTMYSEVEHTFGTGGVNRLFGITQAAAIYQLPNGTWTSEECGLFWPVLQRLFPILSIFGGAP